MYAWKPTSADNKISIEKAEHWQIKWIFSNLKSDDEKELAEDMLRTGLDRKQILDRILFDSKVAFSAFLYNELLFCAGLYKEPNNILDGDIMWWVPSYLCEEKPVAYARASYNMIFELKKHADKRIYTYTPTWYSKNFRPTEHLGFTFINEFELNGGKFLLSALEVNNG